MRYNNSSIKYNYYLQNMSKKEENFSFFSCCLSPQRKQMQIVIGSPDEIRSLSRKDIKISLKHNKQQSIQSNLSTRNQRFIQSNKSQKMEQFRNSIKENRFLSTNRTFNSPCQRKQEEKVPLNRKVLKISPIHESEKYISFIYSNDSKLKCTEERALQRTTKIYPQNSKQSIKSSHIRNLELQETKILKKSNFITNLDSYKQSVVSINNQNESICQRLQESMIMIDYFHPAQEKIQEIQDYLIRRN